MKQIHRFLIITDNEKRQNVQNIPELSDFIRLLLDHSDDFRTVYGGDALANVSPGFSLIIPLTGDVNG